MSELNPEQSSNPESFASLRDNALQWIEKVAFDVEIDRLVVTPEGGQVWQTLMTKFMDTALPGQYEKSFQQWRSLHQLEMNKDRGVRAKNLFLNSLAGTVEEEASLDGSYLRELLAYFNNQALLTDDDKATRRSQFMGLWVIRKIASDHLR